MSRANPPVIILGEQKRAATDKEDTQPRCGRAMGSLGFGMHRFEHGPASR